VLLRSGVPHQVIVISCPSNRDCDRRGILLASALAAALGSHNLLFYVFSYVLSLVFILCHCTRRPCPFFLICLAYVIPVLSSFWTQTQRFPFSWPVLPCKPSPVLANFLLHRFLVVCQGRLCYSTSTKYIITSSPTIEHKTCSAPFPVSIAYYQIV